MDPQETDSLRIPLEFIREDLVLTISANDPTTLCRQADAEEHGESAWQLTEGCEYEFEFSDPAFSFEPVAGIVRRSRNRPSHGLLRPNNFTGTLRLNIRGNDTNVSWPLLLEIRSSKVSYRYDYRFMLENITEYCTDLLLRHTSPVIQNFEPDPDADTSTLYQRFSFVRSVVQSDEFAEAIHRILLFPATKWKTDSEDRNISSVQRFGKQEIRQLTSGGKRIATRDNAQLTSVPERIRTGKQTETIDTHENRFIKYALEQFLLFCIDIERRVSNSPTGQEARQLIHRLEDYLNHDLFRSVSSPTNLKLNSPILQRKEGYREALRSWLLFDLAAKLIWKGGDDVYSGGKRDIAILYEYWVFFQLLEAVQRVFRISPESLSELIGETDDGLGLRLKKGSHIAVSGVSDTGPRLLNVEFSFNRPFRKSDYPEGGSWSLTLYPDYTLSLWPAGMDVDVAEAQELIVHIHFDAKYKTRHLVDDGLSEEETNEASPTEKRYKNEDLIKMHAYRDAIRRTAGAYIIYPGNVPYERRGFQEILPGLGAFAVSPSRTDTGIRHVEQFILAVRNHLMNRASQREQLSAHTWSIYQHEPIILDASLPEFGRNQERLVPTNTTVLVGYFKSSEHLDWSKQNGVYNFRTGSGRGALQLTPEVVGAHYLLLYSKEMVTSELLEIVGAPQFWSKQQLIDHGYPGKPSQEGYLVVSIRTHENEWFNGLSWNITQFEAAKTAIYSRYPFQVTLAELMSIAIRKKDE